MPTRQKSLTLTVKSLVAALLLNLHEKPHLNDGLQGEYRNKTLEGASPHIGVASLVLRHYCRLRFAVAGAEVDVSLFVIGEVVAREAAHSSDLSHTGMRVRACASSSPASCDLFSWPMRASS